jgi:hypothetical protein
LRPAWRVICCSGISVALSYLEIFLTQPTTRAIWFVGEVAGRGEASTGGASGHHFERSGQDYLCDTGSRRTVYINSPKFCLTSYVL